MGFFTHDTRSSLGIALGISLGAIGLGLFLYTLNPEWVFVKEIFRKSQGYSPLLIVFTYVVISVPIQEILFRGFYLFRLHLLVKNPWMQIILSSVLFMSMHLGFENKLFVMSTFFLGIIWGWLFFKYKNIYAPMLSHALIGSVMLLLSSIQ